MAIEPEAQYAGLLDQLDGADWASILEGVGAAEAWVRSATPGDPRVKEVVARLIVLANHSKWEIRRAVANAAAHAPHPSFETALVKLATDDNTRVRQAAERAVMRRRDWQNASTLGKQHEERLNSTLDDIEVRFGTRGRQAVKRAAEHIANTFARELYHEVIRLLTPLAMSADRLRTQLSNENARPADLAEEAARIGSRVNHLRAVLEGMRAYTATPQLRFSREPLKGIIEEAVALVREGGASNGGAPVVNIQVEPALVTEVSRDRFLQAITNLLTNSVESYTDLRTKGPIVVRAEAHEGWVAISIADAGCGMSQEDLEDATRLFATKKELGTGFGLPLAVKIIESEHGGRLSLESVRGHGTTVRLIVPSQR